MSVMKTLRVLAAFGRKRTPRTSIFEAMQRKETFAASGPHIKLRFFGGWKYKGSDVEDKAWVKTGYKEGVPMGGDLKKMDGKAPTFIVWAVKDPTSGNLDRIQIVKGWTKNGRELREDFRCRVGRRPQTGCS